MRTKISLSILFIILLTSLLTVKGQERTEKKSTESYITIDKAIPANAKGDAQKELQNLQKTLLESFAAQEKAIKDKYKVGMMDEQDYQKALADLMERQMKIYKLGENYTYVYKAPQGNVAFTEAFHVADIYSRRENNSMNISKTLEDVSLSTDFQYEVKEGTNNVSFFVNGTLKGGELKITLKKPDQTAFQEFTISPLADVNWNQQFRWEDEESTGYLGKWTISISASKANGNYSVQVNSR